MYLQKQTPQQNMEEIKMTLYEELVRRGLIAQVTDEEEIKELINTGKATFYIGFDCTAANQRDWAVACHLQTLHQGQRHKVSGGQAVGGAVKATAQSR